jgi:hypothetical protein
MLGLETDRFRGIRSTSIIELSTLEAATINLRIIAIVATTAIGMGIEERVPGITFSLPWLMVWVVASVMEIMVTETTAMETTVDTTTTTAMEMAGVGGWATGIEEDADTEATAAMVIGLWDGDLADGALAR